MRIVLLITMGIDRPSGQRYFHIARGLAQRGHQVRILALHPDLTPATQRRLVRGGVEVWYVGPMHARKRAGSSLRYSPAQLVRALAAAVMGMVWGVLCSPADVYHLGKPQPVNGLAALLSVWLLRRQSFAIDCDDDESASNQFTAAWQRGVFAFWQTLLPHLAAGATVNTHTLAARMPGRLPVTYVPNGVDTAAFQRPPANVLHALRQALKLEGRRVVAYSGTLGLYNHPIDLLFDAFTLVLRAVPDALLLMIGGGPDAALLRSRLQAQGILPHVCWIGYVPQASTRAYLALAQVSADPVRDDAVARARSPLKLFESLALGVPVVTGAVGDRAEWLAHGAAGRLVAPDSAEALAEGIIELLGNDELCERMAHAAQQQARRYDWHTLAGHWLQAYASPHAKAG